MLITGIKSKPVYEPLKADTGGRYHVMLGVGPGGGALLRVLTELKNAVPEALDRTTVLYTNGTPGGSEERSDDPNFAALGVGHVSRFAGAAQLIADFRALLERSLMGTRLYVAGPESFIGLAMKTALEFNLNKDEVRAEELGSLARRVYCVHCRSTAEEVTTNIVRCGGCARWLLVRDHYSRRLAAYMGVMVDAEAPGELPPVQQVFV